MPDQGADPDTCPAGGKAAHAANVPLALTVAGSIGAIAATDWDRLANPHPATANPFVSHAFLHALEATGCVGPRTGWRPQHLVLRAGDTADANILAVAPAYLKSHSKGEYVFDYGWADAYERAGGRYYPKLQIAVPFTPVPGPRLLAGSGPEAAERRRMLAAGAAEVARRQGLSSVHITFLPDAEADRLDGIAYLRRTDQQFHWRNAGYATFDAFLATLASRKRKAVRRERALVADASISIDHISGADITEAHWDTFFSFYMETGSRKYGRPYLNRAFFSALGAALPDSCLLVMARRGHRCIAGALNIVGGDCLYGRYWGATEHHPCLHFEVCYYQAIEYAIAHQLARVEAGAQGEHKLARGYLPTTTHSAHWIADPGFRNAVARYLSEERRHVADQIEVLAQYAPYRRNQLHEPEQD